MLGRRQDAEELFKEYVALAGPTGLMAEEYDPVLHRQLGNFPQAFTHVSLVNTAHNLMAAAEGPALKSPAANRSGH